MEKAKKWLDKTYQTHTNKIYLEDDMIRAYNAGLSEIDSLKNNVRKILKRKVVTGQDLVDLASF